MFGCGVKEFTSNEYGDDDDDDEQPLCLALVTHNIRHKLMKKITVNCLESGEIILHMLNSQHWQRQRLYRYCCSPQTLYSKQTETTRGFASRSCIRCINEVIDTCVIIFFQENASLREP